MACSLLSIPLNKVNNWLITTARLYSLTTVSFLNPFRLYVLFCSVLFFFFVAVMLLFFVRQEVVFKYFSGDLANIS